MTRVAHVRRRVSILSIAVVTTMLSTVVAPFSAFAAVATPIAHAYPFFASGSTEAFELGGSAAVNGASIRLTPASADQAGTMFTKQDIHLRDDGAFSAMFSFKIDPADGGNGLSFIIASDPTSLVPSGVGFTGGGNTMRVEFDTHQDAWDVNDNHVTFGNGGDETRHDTGLIYTPTFDLDDGAPKYVWVDYNGYALYVTVSDSPVRSSSPQLSCGMQPGYLPFGATEGDVHFGFLASTGADVANHDILSCYLDNQYYNYPYLDPNQFVYATGPAQMTGSAENDQVPRNGTTDVTFLATDKSGLPMADQLLTVTTPLGGSAPLTVTTNEAGKGIVTFTAPDARQLCTVMAETEGGLRATVELAIDDTPPTVSVGTEVTALPRGNGGIIAPTATVSDADDTMLAGARISILDGEEGEYLRWITSTTSIYGAPSSTAYTLIMSGDASLADYQTALREVAYAGSPASTTRTIEFAVYDGVAWSDPVTKTVEIEPMYSPAGSSRYETAVDVSQDTFPRGADVVIIATGENWPDALGGSALGGWMGGPVLLTPRTVLPEVVEAEIERLGATRAYVLGGEGAVAPGVYDGLVEMLGAENVTRIGGRDRYETANLIAQEFIAVMGEDFDGQAFVATGSGFADALVAAPIAGYAGMPIFLSGPEGLSEETAQLMADEGVSDVVLLGGKAALPSGAEVTILSAGMTAIRIQGIDRYETAAKVAQYGVDEWGMRWEGVGLATGMNFPDTLAGGVAQCLSGSTLLLSNPYTLSAPTKKVLEDNAGAIRGIRFFGGTSALSQAVRDAAMDAVEP